VIDDFEDDVAGNHAFPRWAMLIREPAAVPAAPVAASSWTAAHADLHWANVLAPDCALVDWEGWGLAPAGYDAATLYVHSLLAPDTGERRESPPAAGDPRLPAVQVLVVTILPPSLAIFPFTIRLLPSSTSWWRMTRLCSSGFRTTPLLRRLLLTSGQVRTPAWLLVRALPSLVTLGGS